MQGLLRFVSTHSEESDSVSFILCLQYQMLFTSAFPKQNSVISLEEWVLVLQLFTTATRKFRVKALAGLHLGSGKRREVCHVFKRKKRDYEQFMSSFISTHFCTSITNSRDMILCTQKKRTKLLICHHQVQLSLRPPPPPPLFLSHSLTLSLCFPTHKYIRTHL